MDLGMACKDANPPLLGVTDTILVSGFHQLRRPYVNIVNLTMLFRNKSNKQTRAVSRYSGCIIAYLSTGKLKQY